MRPVLDNSNSLARGSSLLRALLRLAVLASVILAVSTPAQAHRLHAGVAEIYENETTGEVELVIRVFAHDLTEALGFDQYDPENVFASVDGQAAIEAYLRATFRLADGEGYLYDLTWIGAETDEEFGYAYFTVHLPDGAAPEADTGFLVDNDILSDHFDDQVMMTNFRFNSRVRTAMQGPGQRDPVRIRWD